MKMRLRVEYIRNDDNGFWSFRVPALGALGGADTRDLAEREVVGTVVFALEGVESEFADDVTEVGYIEVDVKPGWPPAIGKPAMQEPQTDR